MKELSIEEKAKAYDEAIEKAQKWYDINTNEGYRSIFENIFPELKESEESYDERIKKAIKYGLDYVFTNNTTIYETTKEQCLFWLEKQGKKKSIWHNEDEEPQRGSLILLIMQSGNPIVAKIIEPNHTFNHGERWAYIDDLLEKQGEQKPSMIQWKGNNLKEVIDFTGKDLRFEKWFHSFAEYESYVHEHNNIFKIFNEDGSHIEVPVGAWIVKTPDGYNTASRYVFIQKPADKAEPKFKAGDWAVSKLDRKARQISEVHYDEYNNYYVVGSHEYDTEEYDRLHHLWTIKDAKDGDVLCVKYGNDEMPFIFTGKQDNVAYCALNSFGEFVLSIAEWLLKISVLPATKEQRDTLFAKMKEVGYEWDAGKKELKKISQRMVSAEAKEALYDKPTWSEEDERKKNKLIWIFEEIKKGANYFYGSDVKETIDWLKSLRPQNTWKPSDEQIAALEHFVRSIGESGYASPYDNATKLLYSLLADLKKLREE